MQEKLPLREAAVGVGVLAGSCRYRLSSSGGLESTDLLTGCPNTLWEPCQKPAKTQRSLPFQSQLSLTQLDQ